MAEGHANKMGAIRFNEIHHKTLRGMLESGTVVNEIRAAGHAELVPIMTEAQAEALRSAARAQPTASSVEASKPAASSYRKGQIVYHKPSMQKVTIIHAAFGKERVGKDMVDVHEVVNKSGKKFLAKETNLRPLSR